ncbi:MAG: outer membrane lipoprotein LolB [Burkholderiaceae bacterium]|nr:outer membrane lipoprotein LolB [Burkholderiaceae bacterium]
MPERRRWLIALGLPLLLGCQALPRQTPVLRHSGRLALQVEGDASRSFTAAFELYGSPAQGRLDLLGPLGTLQGRAEWSAGRARLHSGDEQRDYDSLAALGQDLLGEDLPIEALFDWLAGRSWPGAEVLPRPDAPAAGFVQLDWLVDQSRRSDGLLRLQHLWRSPAVTLRLKLDAP